MNKRRKLLLGIGAGSAMAAWQKPIINSVVVPAHAQMTTTQAPVTTAAPTTTPAPVCPDIVIGNIASNALSGANSNTSCGLTFDILSSDAATALEITAIDNGTLGTGVTVTNDGLGQATTTSGPRVTWMGPINGSAPSDCVNVADIVPTDDVMFTIMATCDTAPDPVTLTINLTDIIAMA